MSALVVSSSSSSSGGSDVADGGTGVTSLTAYAPIFGGTTSTGPVQSGTVGTATHVLTSNGPGAIATFQALPGGSSGANPSASVGLSAVNGVATTFLRSDGAPALDQGIVPTWTGAHAFSRAGATSLSAVIYTGAIFAAGSGTTNFPHVFVQPTGATAVTAWSGAGTIFGANTATGFSGNFLDFHVNGSASRFVVTAAGAGTFASSLTCGADFTISGVGSGIVMASRVVLGPIATRVLRFADTGSSGFCLDFGSGTAEATFRNFANSAEAAIRCLGVFLTGVGSTLNIKAGTNAKSGTFTLVAGTVTVANTAVTANSVIIPTLKTASGVRAGLPDIIPNAGVGFTATSTVGTDAGTYNFVIIEVTP